MLSEDERRKLSTIEGTVAEKELDRILAEVPAGSAPTERICRAYLEFMLTGIRQVEKEHPEKAKAAWQLVWNSVARTAEAILVEGILETFKKDLQEEWDAQHQN